MKKFPLIKLWWALALALSFFVGTMLVGAAPFSYRIEGIITTNTVVGLTLPVGSPYRLDFTYSNDGATATNTPLRREIRCVSPFGSLSSEGRVVFLFLGEYFNAAEIRGDEPFTWYHIGAEDPPSFITFSDMSIPGRMNELDVLWLLHGGVQDTRNGYLPGGEMRGIMLLTWYSPAPTELVGTITNIAAGPFEPVASVRVSEVEICWRSESNKQYRVEYQSALTTNAWLQLAGPIQGTGTNNCVRDPIRTGEPQRYYRIQALP